MIVVEDDNGNIVRETMKDNDVLAQYRTMREVLVMLSHLDYEDTELQVCTHRVILCRLLCGGEGGTQYRTMRETLEATWTTASTPSRAAYNLHTLNLQQMLEKLRLQMTGQWTWHGLNTLCWAIGSISGTMAEEQENRCGAGRPCIATALN